MIVRTCLCEPMLRDQMSCRQRSNGQVSLKPEQLAPDPEESGR